MWYLHLECRNVTVLCCLEFLNSVTVKKILESSDSNVRVARRSHKQFCTCDPVRGRHLKLFVSEFEVKDEKKKTTSLGFFTLLSSSFVT